MNNHRELKERVYNCNLELVKNNLVIQPFSNVNGYNNENKIIIIKPNIVANKNLQWWEKNSNVKSLNKVLPFDKHYTRKHSKDTYYLQKNNNFGGIQKCN